MIKRKIGQAAIQNRLKKLENIQNSRGTIGTVFLHVDEDGKISDGVGRTAHCFETMFEVENYLLGLPGVTSKTAIFIDDMEIASDNLYLTAEPILYFCNSEQRREFIADSLIPEKWLPRYIALIQRVLTMSIENPNMPLPGFDNPALKDLIANYNSMSVGQLIERYKDQKWFKGTQQ